MLRSSRWLNRRKRGQIVGASVHGRLHGVVGGAVVDHEDFEVGVQLLNGFDGLPDYPLLVLGWQDDGDFGFNGGFTHD